MYLKPLSFWEFLLARKGARAVERLSTYSISKPPTSSIHGEMLQLVREYTLVGGMPAAVATYCEFLSLEETSRVQEILLSTYQADFSKYATKAEQKYLKTVFAGIFSLVGEQLKYSKINPDIRSRELKTALDHLHDAGLIYQVFATSASDFPLSAQIKLQKFKTLFLDIGLVQQALKIDPHLVLEQNLIQINRGMMAEQFVGQEILAYSDPHHLGQLFFWEKEKKGSHAEVDFIITFDRSILPIEVKSGSYGKLRSMQVFLEEKKSKMGIRISQKELSFERGILSIPFYLIHQMPGLIDEVLND